VCQRYDLRTMVEVGCGTGWVPTALDPSIVYLAGIDKNPHMLAYAAAKNPSKRFLQCDARDLTPPEELADLVCSFAVLKHFSLAEWPTILSRILSLGRYGLFTQHMLPETRDAMDVGEAFHHIWPTKAELARAVESAGHEIIALDNSWMDWGIGAPEAYVTTRRLP